MCPNAPNWRRTFLGLLFETSEEIWSQTQGASCIRDLHAPQKILKMEPLGLAKNAFPAYSWDNFVNVCLC